MIIDIPNSSTDLKCLNAANSRELKVVAGTFQNTYRVSTVCEKQLYINQRDKNGTKQEVKNKKKIQLLQPA